MFDGRAYEKFVETVAQYPHSGEKTIASLLYPIFGLTGEFGEVLEKINDKNSIHYDVVKELGDVLWYFTRVSNELDHSLNELMIDSLHYVDEVKELNHATTQYIIHIAKVSELSKKAIRDDGGSLSSAITDNRRSDIFKNLAISFSYFKDIINHSGSDVEEVAMVNVDKLVSRVKRGVLNGDGDNR